MHNETGMKRKFVQIISPRVVHVGWLLTGNK